MITFRVVDSSGHEVAGAEVSAGFRTKRTGGRHDKGKTNGKGLFTARGHTYRTVPVIVRKEGFYCTEKKLDFTQVKDAFAKKGRWYPWNATVILVLKEIRNPVPMYAGYVRTVIPVTDRQVGFDFARNDWVKPYGDGATAHVFFCYKASIQDPVTFSHSLTLSFPSPGDGCKVMASAAESDFRSVYSAPEEGYSPSLKLSLNRTRESIIHNDDLTPDQYVIFKTTLPAPGGRTGETPCYGKILGPLQYGKRVAGKSYLEFWYYLNPDGTPNLEFDTGHNLLETPQKKVWRP